MPKPYGTEWEIDQDADNMHFDYGAFANALLADCLEKNEDGTLRNAFGITMGGYTASFSGCPEAEGTKCRDVVGKSGLNSDYSDLINRCKNGQRGNPPAKPPLNLQTSKDGNFHGGVILHRLQGNGKICGMFEMILVAPSK